MIGKAKNGLRIGKQNKLDLLRRLLKQTSIFLLASGLFGVIFAQETPVKAFIIVFMPYFIAWFLLSLLSISVNGIRFRILWMGTYKDKDTYAPPGVYYTVAYLVIVFIILFWQSEIGIV